MCRPLRYAFVALLFPALSAFSQVEVIEDLIPDTELKLYNQHSFFGQIHGNGFGFGYRYGKIRSIYKYNFQEFEFLQLRHPKAIRSPGWNWVGSPRRYIEGGLNQLYAFRYGLGTQRTLNEKPYWGGIQVDYTVSVGAVLGLAIPQYLSIWFEDSNENGHFINTRVERYDPVEHPDNQFINGMGPMFKGLFNLRPYPGVYGRFGFNFDFGNYQERVSALEVGAMIDVFPIPVPMMAHNNKNFFFVNFYIAYHFGRRK
ncbi:MAG: hypothetical protein LBH22_05300 [Bacteroidales bacterium]|jgi:hypothetical protein|nr:hypothetical protein [Bacteroidales bacterium]